MAGDLKTLWNLVFGKEWKPQCTKKRLCIWCNCNSSDLHEFDKWKNFSKLECGKK